MIMDFLWSSDALFSSDVFNITGPFTLIL